MQVLKLVELEFLVELETELVEPEKLVELRDLRINSLTSSAACFLSMGYLLSISGTV